MPPPRNTGRQLTARQLLGVADLLADGESNPGLRPRAPSIARCLAKVLTQLLASHAPCANDATSLASALI